MGAPELSVSSHDNNIIVNITLYHFLSSHGPGEVTVFLFTTSRLVLARALLLVVGSDYVTHKTVVLTYLKKSLSVRHKLYIKGVSFYFE